MSSKHLVPISSMVVILWQSSASLATADSIDVFPLRVGLRSTYQHENQFWGWGIYSSSSDSGTVQLTVIDSSMVNDTTIVWSIRERSELLIWQRTWSGSDTTYFLVDSTITEMHETTRGLHELSTNSNFWSFPLYIPSGPSRSVFRFADSSVVLTTIRTYDCPTFALPSRYDSVWLSSDSGLYLRQWARCEDHDWYGWASWSTLRLLSLAVVSAGQPPSMPSLLRLYQNYPNPFNPTTTISYDLPNRERTSLAVYDLLGRQVVMVSEGVQEPGRHQLTFDGSKLVSGVYFVRLQTSHAVRTNKILLLR